MFTPFLNALSSMLAYREVEYIEHNLVELRTQIAELESLSAQATQLLEQHKVQPLPFPRDIKHT